LEYKITLIFDNRAYITKPEDIGDWYDVKLITTLINKVLSDSKIKEKFVLIETGDQTVQFLFGEETKAKQFAQKHLL